MAITGTTLCYVCTWCRAHGLAARRRSTAATRRGRDDLDVAAVVVMLARPPQVYAGCRARRGHPIGSDQRAVEVDVAVACSLRCQQRPVQARAVCSEHADAFVQVPVGRGGADRVVRGQLRHSCAVEEPAQQEHGLGEAAQRTAAATGASSLAFGA